MDPGLRQWAQPGKMQHKDSGLETARAPHMARSATVGDDQAGEQQDASDVVPCRMLLTVTDSNQAATVRLESRSCTMVAMPTSCPPLGIVRGGTAPPPILNDFIKVQQVHYLIQIFFDVVWRRDSAHRAVRSRLVVNRS